MNNNPLVSILMNCYNGEEYLYDALDSVIKQSYENWEIVFWDNQSTDKSAEIVSEFNDNRIKYIYAKKHTNLGDARKEALKECSGDWIGFLDVDDIWMPDKLEKQIDIVKDSFNKGIDIGFVYGRTMSIDENGNNILEHIPKWLKYRKLPKGDLFLSLLTKGNFISCPSILFSHEAYNRIGGLVDGFYYAPDYYLSTAISRKYRVEAVEGIIAKYRIHSNSESFSDKTFKRKYIEDIKILNLYKNQNIKIRIKLLQITFDYRFRSVLKKIFGTTSIKKIITLRFI